MTAVKLIQPTRTQPPEGLVVVGISEEPADHPVVDDRWETPTPAPRTVALFHATHDISGVRAAVQAFAPHMPIEYATAKQVGPLHAMTPRPLPRSTGRTRG